MLHAIERFHATYPDVILELNVSRHPYSFLGDQRSGTGSMAGYDAPLTQTWHDALLGYMGNNPVARDQAERAMAVQGASAGLNLECVHRVPPPIPTSSLPSTALLSQSDAPCRSFGVPNPNRNTNPHPHPAASESWRSGSRSSPSACCSGQAGSDCKRSSCLR